MDLLFLPFMWAVFYIVDAKNLNIVILITARGKSCMLLRELFAIGSSKNYSAALK